MYNSEIISPTTAEEIANAYNVSMSMMAQGYELLASAEQILENALGDTVHHSHVNLVDRYLSCWDCHKPEQQIKSIQGSAKRAVWRRIVERIELRKMMSLDQQKKLADQLEKGELPEITLQNIFDLLEHYTQEAPSMIVDLMKEVNKILHPFVYFNEKPYKTNSVYEVGKKVIIPYVVHRANYYIENRSKYVCGFAVDYNDGERLNALERVFSILDGKGVRGNGYESELVDKINTTPSGEGETEYFKFKCYAKGTLHIEFKRLDLLKRFNQINADPTKLKG